jgi:Flp pilus assembly protein TadG
MERSNAQRSAVAQRDQSPKQPGKRLAARISSLLKSNNDGNALVEMAITVPLMLMIMTGIFTFSIALYQKLQLADAVGSGGRQLAVSRGVVDPCALATSAIYSAAPGLTQTQISLTFTINGVSTGASCPGSGNTANLNMVSGDNAQIQATYPCILEAFKWGTFKCTLYSQVTEIIQ